MPASPPDPAPLTGQPFTLTGPAPALDYARHLLESLGAAVIAQPSDSGSASADWADSGAMALTGPAEGPPAPAPGAPASALAGTLAAFDLLTRVRTGAAVPDLPGAGLLGERAALAGLSRRAPRSVGGAFRALRAADGWLGLSLARPDDIALLPALTNGDLPGLGPPGLGPPGLGPPGLDLASDDQAGLDLASDDQAGVDLAGGAWRALSAWLADRELGPVAARARLLGLPAAPIPAGPVPIRRPPVLCSPGGPRETSLSAAPLVVDFTSLWAGPLCARLLGLAGARVVKVESRARPDGARAGTPAFFDLLHAGHLSVALDFGAPDDVAALRRLLAQADVVLEASRPRALRQLGLDAEEYVAGGTVWASLTAYGRTSEDAQRIGYGDDVAAAAGLIAHCGDIPYPVGDAIADPLAGACAAAAVAAALLSPHGQLLDVSMYDVAVAAGNPPSTTAVDPAAHAVPADPAEVIATGSQTWAVRTASGLVPVSPPRARAPRSAAARLGRDTREVLAGL
jgi:crotonobetainyl-CoA:carnitine CoA-transferase CaiB-like acyl-CoA transferase